ncbi:MAG: hypothetical protein KGL90_00985 [Burkholderiales bacterium]|nr:hypothetical protein [Burkholderiales bacterium]
MPTQGDGTIAIRCELRTVRSPETTQVLYFYVSDARRTVVETDGNALGNVVQFSPQRIVVTKNAAGGGVRTYVWDRMLGSLTISIPTAPDSKDTWNSLSGDCVKVNAGQQKF